MSGAPAGPAAPTIVVSAVIILRDRRILMVRSRNRDVLYLPGGKVDPGETGIAGAIREAFEETGVRLTEHDLTEFATITEPAHDQAPGTVVAMTLYLVSTAAAATLAPVPSAEVNDIAWLTSADADRVPAAGKETLRLLRAADLID